MLSLIDSLATKGRLPVFIKLLLFVFAKMRRDSVKYIPLAFLLDGELLD